MTAENDAVVRDLQTSVMRLSEELEKVKTQRDNNWEAASALYSACLARISGLPEAPELWAKAKELYMRNYV